MELVIGRNHKGGKLYNRSLLLRLILSHGPVSRLTLSRLTKLSPAAVTILTAALLEEGLLVELDGEPENGFTDAGANRVGRKSVALDLNASAGLALGVHIAPRSIRLGLVDLKGQILDFVVLPPPDHEPHLTLERISLAANALLNRNSLTLSSVVGAGVGAVGLVEAEQGINRRALSLGWHNVPLKSILEQSLGLPVYVDNNVRGMALAELLFGYGRSHQFRNLAVVYVGAGVGSGIVLGGELYRGSNDAAGEIGHVVIDPNGVECYCGSVGCLETVASEAAILAAARQQQLLDSAAQSPSDIDHFLTLVTAGNPQAKRIIELAATALGVAIINLNKVLDADTVILAGRVTRGTPRFLEIIEDVLQRGNNTHRPSEDLTVLASSLGDNIGLVGAAALALHKFFYSQRG